jgi:hypothetical protein
VSDHGRDDTERRRREAIDRYARTMQNRGLSSEADYLVLTDSMSSQLAVDAFDSGDLGITWADVRQRLAELDQAEKEEV